ncbi:hypothetical protein BN946_scf184965.g16 [Trametes cinnabarina]|uniref:Uncharacterized protein n=1 Tax=Pycnoporus cinnabarinus TaxID=5643 RepID=A0A060SS11_PYCCI|nr:hypothetical protein BN946_scf184965.g16 [Trametes cinnabarina]
MATFTSSDVITDILGLLIATRLQIAYPISPMATHDTLPILAPAPQRPAADFATVLRWEETEEFDQTEHQPDTSKLYDTLAQTGARRQYISVEDRPVAGCSDNKHWNADDDTAYMNQAPPWPPAPELIANPPNWGLPAYHSVARPLVVAEYPSYGNATEFSNDWSDEYAAGLFDQPSSPSMHSNHELSWDMRPASVGPREDDKDVAAADEEDATGYFVGRDGTAWPLPPHEFMPSDDRARDRQLDATDPGEPSPTSESQWSESGYRLVWSAEDWSEDDSETGRHSSAPGSDRYASGSEDGGWYSPISQPPTPPDIPHTAPSLADLGWQWYASFGRDLDDPASHTRYLSQKDAEGCDTGGYFLGRDGTLWPLPPPPPPVFMPPKVARGRRGLPKALSTIAR